MKEALFLTVWLRRQEADFYKAKVGVTAVVDAVLAKETSAVSKELKQLLHVMFPFLKGESSESDKKMVEFMRKEVAKGPIAFTPMQMRNPLRERAQAMALPDEFRRKLAAGMKRAELRR